MADTDYVEPLSGEEIVNDVCSQVAEFLRRDCNLRASDAYEGGYSGKITVSLRLYGMDATAVDVEVPFTAALPPGEVDVIAFDSELEIPVEPALNVVRERSEQPVPTLSTLESGEQVVRPRRYVRRERVAAGGATGDTL